MGHGIMVMLVIAAVLTVNMDVGMDMGMLMGMGVSIVGMFMGMGMLMAVAVAAHVIVIKMHIGTLLLVFSFIILAESLDVKTFILQKYPPTGLANCRDIRYNGANTDRRNGT